MMWRESSDSENQQNKNAGNGGDIVKHVVYIATLNYLLKQEPWSSALKVRECHAGRGIYRVVGANRKWVKALYKLRDHRPAPPLHDLERTILTRCDVGLEPVDEATDLYYAGSATLNAYLLRRPEPNQEDLLELYEKNPATRTALRSIFADLSTDLSGIDISIPPTPETDTDFDGEEHIEKTLDRWGRRDIVLLDPFCLWIKSDDAVRRKRYASIFEKLAAKDKDDRPSLMMFWTWGREQLLARSDIFEPHLQGVQDGYQSIRRTLHRRDIRFVRVVWCWGVHFAMWVIVPDEHLVALREVIEVSYEAVRNHLKSHAPAGKDRLPDLMVAVDENTHR